MSEGRVASLNAKRIHHFTNSTDKIAIHTYLEIANGTGFDNSALSYTIMSASISFKYIGNFDSITE